ncbi:unnamed protein product, partial [Staurois parvus]
GTSTDHRGTDQCSPSSATCQCPSVPAVSAHPRHLPVPISATSMPLSAHLSCLSVSPISVSQCHLSVLPISATYQYCQSVKPISASQCRLSVCIISAT